MNASMNGDYEEALRRALHAAADSIEPSADGLERIRERLNRPMLSFESASAWYAGLRRWLEPVAAAFGAVAGLFRPAAARPGHAARPGTAGSARSRPSVLPSSSWRWSASR